MLTDQDIEKLKAVFATKEDLQKFATKEDLKQEITSLSDKFVTKNAFNQTIEDLVEFLRINFENIDKRFNKLDDIILGHTNELRSHRVVLGEHEERIRRLEKSIL